MNNTVLITGASRGIGAATARVFAANGWNVAVNYVNNDSAAQALARELRLSGCDAEVFRCDVADSSAVSEMVSAVTERFGKIDCLVNNAGIALNALITETSDEQWDRVFAVNSTGVFNCCRAVLRQFIADKRGSIVNVSSMWGQVGASCETAYSASKAAVIGFTKALAKEVGPSGIRVNCVAPGLIDTDMNSALTESDVAALVEETPLERMGSAVDVANLIFYLAGDSAGFITGQIIGANGGFII